MPSSRLLPASRCLRAAALHLALVCLLPSWPGGPAVAAQEPPAPSGPPATDRPPAEAPPSLEAGVAQLNRTLERIVELLEAQVDVQQLDVGMKRLDLLAGRLERSQRELRGLQATRSSLEAERIHLEENLARAHRLVETGDDQSSEEERQAYFRELGRQLERVRGEIADLGGQMGRLENEIAGLERDLRGWQDFVDRRLGGL